MPVDTGRVNIEYANEFAKVMNDRASDVKTIFSLDLRSLALFRIMLGLTLVLDMINRMSLIPAFYSDHGILPREIMELGNHANAYHFHGMMLSGSEWFAFLFLAVLLICAVLLLAGFKTRLMTFLCWFLFCSVIVRDYLTVHAGDTLLIVLLFWGMFLPLGSRFSLDSHRSGRSSRNEGEIYFSPASVALYLQFLLIYVTTGLFKAGYDTWIDGSHLYITLSRFDFAEPFALLLYPYYELLKALTHATLLLELFGPFLFFIPFFFVLFRVTGILLFTGLQLSIGLMMDVGLFPLVSISGLWVFLPSQAWDRSSEWLARKAPMPFRKAAAFIIAIHGRFPIARSGDGGETGRIHEQITPISRTRDIVVTLLILYVVTWNISEVSRSVELPASFKLPGYFLKLDQRWSMFASPVSIAEYLQVEAEYRDGSARNLMECLLVRHNSSAEFHHVGYVNYRWRIFLSNKLRDGRFAKYRPYFVDFILVTCGEPEAESPERIVLAGYWLRIGEYYKHTPLERSLLYIRENNPK